MNQTISILKNHRTTRHFKAGIKLPKEELQAILDGALQAPSWQNGQHYSVIVVEDPAKKERLATVSGRNPHIQTSSVFLIFCMDYRAHALASQLHGEPFKIAGEPETLMVGLVDTALVMQNAVVAAESLGYGTVCVGGIRNIVEEVIQLFDLPEYVYPICGLSIGVIDRDQEVEKVKPRFPQSVKVGYDTCPAITLEDVKAYDQVMAAFAEARETKDWSEKFADNYKGTFNPKTGPTLKEKGF